MITKGVLFDLDDTLYEEKQFFESGFGTVAELLEQRGYNSRSEIRATLMRFHLVEDRAAVFQKLAAQLGFPVTWIPELVERFRTHVPRITLAPDVPRVLATMRGRFKLGCVTDGWAAVQRRKIAALKLAPLLDAIVVADELGRAHWKPHPLPFQMCCTALGVSPHEAVFVGDNPERDFSGAVAAGLRFIRIRRPGAYFEHSALNSPDASQPAEICSLSALEGCLTA